jgi:hypothetical protein
MPTLCQRFEAEARKGSSRPLLGEDWVFDALKYPALADFTVLHQEVSLRETPLAILRAIHLAHVRDSSVTVQSDLALCWNGAGDAVELLFDLAESFQRPIPEESVSNIAETSKTGDFGVAWSWSRGGAPNVVAFVRHNVVVLQGHLAGERLSAAAREIDVALGGLKTLSRYAA